MGKMMPVTHICAYVVVPLEEGKPKSLVFAQTSWDGCERQHQIDTMDRIAESLNLYSLSVKVRVTDGDARWNSLKDKTAERVMEVFMEESRTAYTCIND